MPYILWNGVPGIRNGLPQPPISSIPSIDLNSHRFEGLRMPTAVSIASLLPDLGHRTLVMGILNVTPDSFSDGGLHNGLEAACAHAGAMVVDGADMIDIGGESTRPGAAEVGADEEIARILPVVSALSKTLTVPISIDTYKAATARAALQAGAAIVNDVWGLQRDPEIASVAASFGAPVIMMHNREEKDPALDILDDMYRFFEHSLQIARQAGIPDGHIVLDPGIGFGKTPEQNLDALRRIGELKVFGFPVLIGVSRKSFIGLATGRPAQERLAGTLAASMIAVAQGADIVRVHDVREHADACKVADVILPKAVR